MPDTDIADSVVGFHAQQAAEKALKAVLAASGDDFPLTHDLRHLMDRLQAAGKPLPASLREVRVLIPWAIEFRYGETIEDLLERKQCFGAGRGDYRVGAGSNRGSGSNATGAGG